MALDPSLSLLNWLGDADAPLLLEQCAGWHHLTQATSDSHWATCMKSGAWETLTGDRFEAGPTTVPWTRRFGEKWLVFSRGADERLQNAVIHLDRDRGNAYAILEENGIVVLDAKPGAQLAGGSYCDTSLRQIGRELCVAKRIGLRSTRGFQDADLKLRREEEFVRQLPRQAKDIFVSYISTSEDEEHFEYVTGFEQGYSLGEKLFHGTLNYKSVLLKLEELFGMLRERLYGTPHRKGDWSCQEPNILGRVTRRLALIASSEDPAARHWPRLLNADELVINGRAYDGWPKLKAWLMASELDNLARVSGPAELCHGDLILDDMVYTGEDRTLRLVDPNGDSASRVYDVGKIYLSTLSFYEHFKYNQFRFSHKKLELEIELADAATMGVIEEIGLNLPSHLRRAKMWSAERPEPSGGTLLLLNGLHNAALPMFHLLHHHAADRALAFFAIGLIRLNQARTILSSRVTWSPERVLEAHSLKKALS